MLQELIVTWVGLIEEVGLHVNQDRFVLAKGEQEVIRQVIDLVPFVQIIYC